MAECSTHWHPKRQRFAKVSVEVLAQIRIRGLTTTAGRVFAFILECTISKKEGEERVLSASIPNAAFLSAIPGLHVARISEALRELVEKDFIWIRMEGGKRVIGLTMRHFGALEPAAQERLIEMHSTLFDGTDRNVQPLDSYRAPEAKIAAVAGGQAERSPSGKAEVVVVSLPEKRECTSGKAEALPYITERTEETPHPRRSSENEEDEAWRIWCTAWDGSPPLPREAERSQDIDDLCGDLKREGPEVLESAIRAGRDLHRTGNLHLFDLRRYCTSGIRGTCILRGRAAAAAARDSSQVDWQSQVDDEVSRRIRAARAAGETPWRPDVEAQLHAEIKAGTWPPKTETTHGELSPAATRGRKE